MRCNAGIDDTLLYDLVINSDRYNPEQTVEIILVAMRNAGQSLPEAALDSLKSL